MFINRLMNSPEKRKMDDYHRNQIGNNLQHEIKIFDNIITMLVGSLANKHVANCKTSDDFGNVFFDHWECFSEVMPPYREVKWNFMNIQKYKDVADKKGYGRENLAQEEMDMREKCVISMLWFGDVLAYSAGLIKEDLRARRLFGLDD